MSFLWRGVSRSVLTSECPLLPSCPNPFIMMTSQSVLEASSDQESCMFASDDIAAPWFSPSVATPCSVSISLSLLLLMTLLSRFSLLLESRCLLPSWGRRRRPCFRPVFLGLPLGLLFLLKGLPTLLMEDGVAETTGDSHVTFFEKEKEREIERRTSAGWWRTGYSSGRNGGHRRFSYLLSLEVLYQALALAL